MGTLERRIIDIAFKYKLSHIGSCITCVNAIDKIYSVKKKNEPFILSNGHAALALYVVLEKHEGLDAEVLWNQYGTHPMRNLKNKIWCSTGSLGQGITVGLGMALANRKRIVYVMISDGECAEGSVWEALRIAGEQRLENLRVTCVANGYGAMEKIDVDDLDLRLQYFYPVYVVRANMFLYPDWIQGLAGHYVYLDELKYNEIIKS